MRNSIYAGLGPQSLQGPGSRSADNPAFPWETYQTPLLDLTKTYSNIEIVPARLGYFPFLLIGTWLIEQRSGTQTSPPTIQAGSDANHVNFIASSSPSPTNADTNNANPPSQTALVGGAVMTLQRIVNAPVYMDVTVAASGTGGYSCMASFVYSIMWVASGN